MGALDAESVAKMLAVKLRALPAASIAEIEEFIDRLVQRNQGVQHNQGAAGDRELTRRAMAASEASLAAVWDNPEDDVYDAL